MDKLTSLLHTVYALQPNDTEEEPKDYYDLATRDTEGFVDTKDFINLIADLYRRLDELDELE